MARSPKGAKQVGSLNHPTSRTNIPTAEMADLAAMQEEIEPLAPVRYARARPLAEGEERERDGDLDPQLIWNGVRITLTKDQVAQLGDTGSVEIGDAQLVWRGKDRQDWSDLIVTAPMIHTQEKVHPKQIIDDLMRQSNAARDEAARQADDYAPDLFADFNGLPDPMARTEFYQHDQHWSNRMILGDSLQVMASLAEREALKGKVQAIYFDPPYGIKFNSNWQVSTQSRDVKDGKREDLSREPEQVKAFRDTWKDGIHSYLTYLRDRLTVMRELLTESGSIFVQIGDDNVHRVRTLMEEVFGAANFCGLIQIQKTSGAGSPAIGTDVLASVMDYVVWFSRNKAAVKYRQIYREKQLGEEGTTQYTNYRDREGWADGRIASRATPLSKDMIFASDNLTSPTGAVTTTFEVPLSGQKFKPKKGGWKTNALGMSRLEKGERLKPIGNTLMYRRFLADFSVSPINNLWRDVLFTGFAEDKTYVVQTAQKVVQRCILMATDPGDLVLDPTCGSGTTAFVAEQWGRRWITIDTSRVALALARTRIMAARYPWYLLADSTEGKRKEAELTGRPQGDAAVHGDVRQGFVYERVPHVTLKSIANNAEIDVIWDKWQAVLEPLRGAINAALIPPRHGEVAARRADGGAAASTGSPVRVTAPPPPAEEAGGPPPRAGEDLQEWQIPREAPANWSDAARSLLSRWWQARIARQKEIDASIARAADVEYLYDKPYTDPNRVRVAGPFTVESLSPHRIVPADADELIHLVDAAEGKAGRDASSAPDTDFATIVLDHLRTAGVHSQDRGDRIEFTSITPWPGSYVGADARYMEGETERRAAVFIGPEFGTVSRVQLTAAAREASESRFDVLIATSFAFDAMASELTRLGPLPILKAKMNPDLHMADDLKNTGKGNLFTIFGEPDIDILEQPDGRIAVKVNGVDIYDPNTGEVRSNDVKGIAAWFIDTAYNEESFFVRHAYFLGANDPYKQLKTSLRAEIDEDAWASLYRDTSRPFERPSTGRIAVKVINHFGDEVMKVFGV